MEPKPFKFSIRVKVVPVTPEFMRTIREAVISTPETWKGFAVGEVIYMKKPEENAS